MKTRTTSFGYPFKSRKAACTWLHDLGYKHGDAKKRFASTETRKPCVREYPIDLAKAYETEREENAVLVLMDESCSNVNRCKMKASNETKSNTMSRGARVIILHTITRDSPLDRGSFMNEQRFPRK